MTVKIPVDLETAIERKAAQRSMSIEQLIQEALRWYLRMDVELLDELDAWQEVRDEAARTVDGKSA